MDYNYHTHTYRCGHAVGLEREYIERAISCGIKKMGFSDHNPFRHADGYEAGHRVQTNMVKDYFDTLKDLREEYKDKIEIYIGFEMENFSSYFGDIVSYALLNGAEYFILGQHFINTDRKDDPNGLEFINAFEPFDDEERLIKAVDAVVEAVNSGYISIVAHPDHINFIGDEQIYHREMRRICDACIENGVYVEINCLGIRSHRHYPNEKFWRLAGETGVKVVYGFDAHDPLSAYDGESIPQMLALVEKYNLNFEKNPTLKLFNR